jgi:hypothetical protein
MAWAAVFLAHSAAMDEKKDETSSIFHAKGVAATQQRQNTRYCGETASAPRCLSLQDFPTAPKAGSPAPKNSYPPVSLIWRGFHIF